ncbi:MAG: hypothetical protein Q9227_006795 [Pyrenula ochraceoflavens]
MEALSVLSLVSNIVQLVDVSTKAAKVCYEIYKHGATSEDLQLAHITDQLQQCYSNLENSLQSSQAPPGISSSVDLKALSLRCCQSARGLRDELQVLQAGPTRTRREAVVKFIQRVRKASDIEKKKKKLDELQKSLDTMVLFDARRLILALSEQQTQLSVSIQDHLANVAVDLSSCNNGAAQRLKTEIEAVIEANKREHDLTRTQIQTHFDITIQQLTTTQAQQQKLKERRDQVLQSLWFEDINHRQNNISEANPRTFGWIYDESIRLGDSFREWLERDQGIYWISGKAGSGKSTLMRFINHNERTHRILEEWSEGKGCVVLTFYFWLSGKQLQRSSKGFFCSLLHQMLFDDVDLLRHVCSSNESIATKKTLADWAPSELRASLEIAIREAATQRKLCAFIDGMDEFDQNEEVGELLDFILHITGLHNIKFCISSRPEVQLQKQLDRYSKLQLERLIQSDMDECIREALQRALSRYRPLSVSEEDIRIFTREIRSKAEGVFLWVHFALESLIKGMHNEDGLQTLLERLEELPSGMEQLYLEMWRRQNGNDQRYREEAARLLSFQKLFPMSLFELMVADTEEIRERYLQDLQPQGVFEVLRQCEIFRVRVITRSAGLLTIEESSSRSEQSSLRSLPRGKDAQSDGLRDLRKRCYVPKVNYFHRTARDFICSSQLGRSVIGLSSMSSGEIYANTGKARLAVLLQGFKSLEGQRCKRLIKYVGEHNKEIGTGQEFELLEHTRHVFESLSVPGIPEYDCTRSMFWRQETYLYPTTEDLVTTAACFGCISYVKAFVSSQNNFVSSYYRGLLFLYAVRSLRSLWIDLSMKKRKLQLAEWLSDNRADMFTKQVTGDDEILSPFECLLHELFWLRSYDKHLEMWSKHDVFLRYEILPEGMRLANKLFVRHKDIGPHDTFKFSFLDVAPLPSNQSNLPESLSLSITIRADLLYTLVTGLNAPQVTKMTEERYDLISFQRKD